MASRPFTSTAHKSLSNNLDLLWNNYIKKILRASLQNYTADPSISLSMEGRIKRNRVNTAMVLPVDVVRKNT